MLFWEKKASLTVFVRDAKWQKIFQNYYGDWWRRFSETCGPGTAPASAPGKEENRKVAFMCLTYSLLILVQLLEKICVDSGKSSGNNWWLHSLFYAAVQ
ncbi:MAG: hypothetical protein QXR19_14400 [Candidatus Jordarchaeaceae archaeon]